VAIRIKHDPANALEAHATLTRYVNAVEDGDHDADELVSLLSRTAESLEVESHALRRTLGR
jgi:hypothetical protein